MKADKLKGHLDLLLLAVLEAGPAHGYALIGRLRERSDGAFDLPEGTVYPALHRLEGAGLAGSEWSSLDGRRRRVYALTSEGRTALARQRSEWVEFSRGVGRVSGAWA
jgi:DNA-binding PadR family transcriptional regulator